MQEMTFIFRSQYHEDIKQGTITETVRYWNSWKASHFKANGIYFCHNLGYIMVEAIDKVKLDELTDDDALRCGFTSAAELKSKSIEVYKKLFPDKNLENDMWYKVRFKYLYEALPK